MESLGDQISWLAFLTLYSDPNIDTPLQKWKHLHNEWTALLAKITDNWFFQPFALAKIKILTFFKGLFRFGAL